MLVGICGRSCCGKDYVIQSIASSNRQVLHVNCDMFFKSKTNCTYKGYPNWEDVDSIHVDRLLEALRGIKRQKNITLKDRSPWWGSYDCEILKGDYLNRNIVIFQGFLLFAVPEVADQLDYKIFMHIDDETLLYRRLTRDGTIEHIDYYHDVVIPASHVNEKAQKSRADDVIDNMGNSAQDATNKIVDLINKKSTDKLSYPKNNRKWTVYPDDLICDHEWHPIDFMDLKEHVKNHEEWMKSGNIVDGNSFQYRMNPATSDYEIRLSLDWPKYRHICRYTTQDTQPKFPAGQGTLND